MGAATFEMETQYSGAARWLALAALWPLCSSAQLGGARERTRAATRRAPESVRVLDEVIERLTDAPLYRDNAVELLLDGPETLEAMREAIASAEHHVHLETYIFASDEVGTEFAEALAAKARMGVDVRVIYDTIGSRSAVGEFWAGLEAAGVVVRAFNPADPTEDQNPFDIDTRDHRKLLIVDGAVAFTGGINIDRNYARPSDVVGGDEPVIGMARHSYPNPRAGRRRISGPVRGSLGGARFAARRAAVCTAAKTARPRQHARPRARRRRRQRRRIADLGGLSSRGQSSARSNLHHPVLLRARRGAHGRNHGSGRARRRRPHVGHRILGLAGLLNASRAYYSDLLAAGIKVFESQENIMHAKTMVVDGYWSTVGSSNLDYLSFLHNHEVNAVILGAEFAAELEDVFLADLENSVEIDAERWRERSLWQRAKELGSYLVRYRL